MADIPIDAIPRRVQFTGNTGLGPFAFTFNILAAADIAVYKNATLLTITTDYTVSLNANGTGSVTLTGAGSGTALVAADYLTIIGDLPLARTTDFTTAGDLLASALNDQLDASVVMTQQISERVDRALRQDPNDVDGDMTIPEKADRLGKYLKFNDTTGNPEAGDTAGLYTAAGMNHYNFTGDGTTVNFTLGMDPGGENNTQVYIDGVYQQKDGYNVSGAVVQFSVAPPNLSTIEVMVIEVLPVGATTASQVSFTQAGSTYARNVQLKLEESVSVKDFGAIGDGVTDDTVAIQAAIAASANKTLIFDGTYKLTGYLSIESPCVIDLQSSTLNFTLTTDVPGVHIKSDNVSITDGTINVTASGYAAGYGGNCVFVGSLGVGSAGYDNFRISNLTLSSDRGDGAGAVIGVMGGSSNGIIENIIVPDAVVSPNIIGIEWRGDATGTEHPHNITVRNLQIGQIDSVWTRMAWVSSAFNVSIENVWAKKIGHGFFVYAGDRSNEWASVDYAGLVGTGLSIRNSGCMSVTEAGLELAGKGNIAVSQLPLELTADNCRFKSNLTTPSSGDWGLFAEQTSKFQISNSTFDGFYRGAYFSALCSDFRLEKCQFLNSETNGGFFGTSTAGEQAKDGVINDCLFKDSNQSGGTSSLINSNLVLYSDNMTVNECKFDAPAAMQAVYIVSPSKFTKLINNTAINILTGKYFVVNDSTGNKTIETLAQNNYVEPVSLFSAGADVFSTQDENRTYYRISTPNVGTYSQGTKFYDSDPAAGGFIGSVCTSSGTFGTYSEGRTLTADGSSTVTLSAASSVLYQGEYITIGGVTDARIKSISGTTMILDTTVGSGSGLSISYTTPIFKTYGTIS